MPSIFESYKKAYQDEPSTNNALNLIYDDGVFTAPDADEVISSIEMKFIDDFKVQMALGWYYDIKGLPEKADIAFECALRIDPEDAEARKAVAIGYIQNKNFDGAEFILEKMEKSGQIRDYTLLNQLAEEYLAAGKDEEALYLFHKICQLFMYTAKNNKFFRKQVLATEKRLGKHQSILPPPPFNWSWVLGILVIVGLGIIFVCTNYILKNYNPVYFLNGYDFPIDITINDNETFRVYKISHHLTELPEGEHEIKVKFPEGKEITSSVKITGGMGKRFFGRRDRFFNINLGAVLFFEEVVYSVNPSNNPNPPIKLYAGKEFYELEKTDYPFEDFPKEVTLPEGSSTTTKSGISLLKGYPIDVFDLLVEKKVALHDVLAYTEAQLEYERNNTTLMNAYVQHCYNHKQESRMLKFLEARLFDKVVIELHRHYQTLISGKPEKLAALKTDYDKALKKKPKQSDLLYLRGRLEDDKQKAEVFFLKSMEANPKNSYPYRALGHACMLRGDLAKAREYYLKALKLAPLQQNLKTIVFELNYGLKKYDLIIADCQAVLKKTPCDYDAFEQLLQVYYAKNEIKKANTLEKKYLRDYGKKYPKSLDVTKALIKSTRLYLAKDFQKYLKSADRYSKKYSGRKIVIRYIANINLFQMKAAQTYWGKPENVKSGYPCLIMMLGWKYGAKNKKEAAFWRKLAIKRFKEYGKDGTQIARMLEKKGALDLKEVDKLAHYQVSDKAILCTALASLYPKQKKELLDRAEKLNFNMFYPHYFVDSMIKKVE